jgi:hypothetical protein
MVKTRPNSTGDEELDKYVGTEEITYLDFMSYEPSDEIIAFFDNRFSLIGYRTSQELIDEIKTLSPDENDVDAFEQFWIMRINCYLPKKIMRDFVGSLFNLGMPP